MDPPRDQFNHYSEIRDGGYVIRNVGTGEYLFYSPPTSTLFAYSIGDIVSCCPQNKLTYLTFLNAVYPWVHDRR
jgi:hypothetical protein